MVEEPRWDVYVSRGSGVVARTLRFIPNVTVDLAENGSLVGVKVLGARGVTIAGYDVAALDDYAGALSDMLRRLAARLTAIRRERDEARAHQEEAVDRETRLLAENLEMRREMNDVRALLYVGGYVPPGDRPMAVEVREALDVTASVRRLAEDLAQLRARQPDLVAENQRLAARVAELEDILETRLRVTDEGIAGADPGDDACSGCGYRSGRHNYWCPSPVSRGVVANAS